MDLALTINGWMDEEVIFAQQLGARTVFARVDVGQVALPGGDVSSLAGLANRIQKAGLGLAGLYAFSAPTGRRQPPSLADQATRAGVECLVKEAGAAGIGLLNLSTALWPVRKSGPKSIRAALTPLVAVAAQAGVRLALPARWFMNEFPGVQAQGSPFSPAEVLQNLPGPITGLDGTPRLLLDWSQKTTSEVDLQQLIQDKLYLVSFENDRQTGVPSADMPFGAAFDDLLMACYRLRKVGYAGFIRLGQPVHWKGDTREGHRALAFAAGYLRAVQQALQSAGAFPD